MNNNESEPIKSEFCDDPDMQELVQDYVSQIPERVNSMQSAYERQEHEHLVRMAHQLKGSGGGYGFPLLTEVAGNLEDRLHKLNGGPLATAESEFNLLLSVCNRIAA